MAAASCRGPEGPISAVDKRRNREAWSGRETESDHPWRAGLLFLWFLDVWVYIYTYIYIYIYDVSLFVCAFCFVEMGGVAVVLSQPDGLGGFPEVG